MVSKRFYIPSLAIAFVAWFLLLLCTISTPTTFHTSTPFNFVEATNLGNVTDMNNNANQDRNLTAIKLGSWGYCTKGAVDQSYNYCSPNDHGYNVTLRSADRTSQAAFSQTTIKSSWTRGLVVVVVAFVASFVGFVLAIVPAQTVQLAAGIVLLLSTILTLIAFAIQIALFVYTKARVNDIASNASVLPGPAFYLTLIALVLLAIATTFVGLGWRKERDGDYLPSSYSGPTTATATNGGSFKSRISDKLSFGRSSRRSEIDGSGDKIAMNQTSRQRVLDAYKSDA